MASVLDVASYILARKGPMTAMKLQKLVYYSQAWSLVWDEAELFPEEIEAWANGPVVRSLYAHHRQLFRVDASVLPPSRPGSLTAAQQETINRVLDFYGDKSAQWLSDLSHIESPWKQARENAGAAPGDACSAVISTADMAEYYGGLMPNNAT